MQDTNANRINKQANGEVEKPKMTKPVVGTFKQNKKKLGPMVRKARQQTKKGDK